MKENNINEEVVPAVLGSDDLVRMADYAEKRVDSIKRIKVAALKVTNESDWVDQNGKPYMQASAAEKIARLFGISWRIDEPELQTEEDGHYNYNYKGYFTLAGITVEIIGSRGSRDPFFSRSHEKDIAPSEIDRNNVRKSAFTNLLGNGITRLLGLRNLAYQDLKDAGLDITKISKVPYKEKEMTKDVKEQRDKIESMLLEMAGNSKVEAAKLLIVYTSFVTKDGKEIKGKSAIANLSEKAIPVTYGKVKEAYEEWEKEGDLEKKFREHEKKIKKGEGKDEPGEGKLL